MINVYFVEEEHSSTASSSLSMFRSCRPIQKSPTRTFSQFDFTDCECNLRLLTAYTHVLEHCRGIGKAFVLHGQIQHLNIQSKTYIFFILLLFYINTEKNVL